ncbi:response regulator [Actinoplanes sp. NPDC004185]
MVSRQSTRVLVVDDDPMVCAHLRMLLEAQDDIEVVDQVYDGAAAVEAVIRHRPDIVLMDLRMPGMDGLAAIERISAMREPPVVVVLTTFDADHYVIQALRAGAAGFLLKTTPPQDLVHLVRIAVRGHTVLSPVATQGLLSSAQARQTADADRTALVRGLTEREEQVLTLLGDGLPNAAIAARLFLTEATVKGYVSRILVKLGCDNRAQAAIVARDAGMGS